MKNFENRLGFGKVAAKNNVVLFPDAVYIFIRNKCRTENEQIIDKDKQELIRR